MRTRVALLVVGGALSLVIAPAAAADRFFARSPVSVQNLTAYNGLVAWGGRGPFGEGTPAYRASRGGAVTRLGIRKPAGDSFLGSIDLGPDRHGGAAAVYERCPGPTPGLIVCDIYRYGVASHRSRRVPGAASRRFHEHAPSSWRGRVVFARTRIDSRGDNFVLRGPGLGLFENSPFARLARPRDWVTRTDLRGRTVAYATGPVDPGGGVTKIFVARIGRRGRARSCQIARATDQVSVGQPQLDGPYVYWLRQAFTTTSPTGWYLTIHRRRLPTSSCHSRGAEQLEPRGIPFRPGNFAVDRGRLFYSSTTFGAEIRQDIFELQPVHFTNR